MPTETLNRPLRVLALHGYLQTGKTLRERTGPLRRALKNKIELIFIDGPLPASSDEEVLRRDDGKRIEGKGDEVVTGLGWWNYEKDPDRGDGSPPTFTAVHWRDSIELVKQKMIEHAPIDGLLGFSQGSALAALYVAEGRRATARLPPETRARFLMLFAAFLPRDAAQRASLAEPIDGGPAVDVPTLVVYGEADAITPPAMARGLRSCVSDLREHQHPGGHSVPSLKSGSGDKEALLGFYDHVCDVLGVQADPEAPSVLAAAGGKGSEAMRGKAGGAGGSKGSKKKLTRSEKKRAAAEAVASHQAHLPATTAAAVAPAAVEREAILGSLAAVSMEDRAVEAVEATSPRAQAVQA